MFKSQRRESRQVTSVTFEIRITIIARPISRRVKATNDVVLVLRSRHRMYPNETSGRSDWFQSISNRCIFPRVARVWVVCCCCCYRVAGIETEKWEFHITGKKTHHEFALRFAVSTLRPRSFLGQFLTCPPQTLINTMRVLSKN